jgi:hypothetical protein
MKNTYCNISNIKNCKELLDEYKAKSDGSKTKGQFLSFDLKDLEKTDKKLTVYNPTKPIIKNGKKHLVARVEPKDSEQSKAIFFIKENKKWHKLNHPSFNLQDPFYIENIQGWQILGGVEIETQGSEIINFCTVFYRYKNCATELINPDGDLEKPFAIGPKGMKDTRLIELKNGNIGVFTRPQGGKAGLGKIAYIEIENLDRLEKSITKARIIPNQFSNEEWGGVNELHLLENGKVGVLGHIAHFEGDIRHYYAMSFVFDTENRTATPIEILTTADEFPSVKSKKPDLGKIIFSGGLDRKKDGLAHLYVGVGDTKAGQIQVVDPF